MDRAIVLSVLLLVGLTWLLYKLTAMLEPRGEKPPSGPQDVDTGGDSAPPSVGTTGRKPIHQRLRK
ncbi:MAG TPA: hypothetical protein VGD45_13270 [Steroidobacter sp.]|uniref:hypothetical protein n=1 Tax=Steroidobacter sp. TaxID=1978227 RepID=UPI002EDA2DCF